MVVIRHSCSSNLLTTCSLLQANSLFTCLLTILYLKSVLAKMKTNSSFRYRTMVEINISSKVKEVKALQ
jgi:hypothetical protein